jgi:hypothetical protein
MFEQEERREGRKYGYSMYESAFLRYLTGRLREVQ